MNQQDLDVILRAFGLVSATGLVLQHSANLVMSASVEEFANFEVSAHCRSGNRLYWRTGRKTFFREGKPEPAYHALLDHVTFTGERVEPLWWSKDGEAVIARYRGAEHEVLLIGLDVAEEIIRHRQGNPAKVQETKPEDKAVWGFGHERPMYLFNDQLLTDHRTRPWADLLGFFVAEALARLGRHPLFGPLPGGARGAVILTGDDDQAHLEKYNDQLSTIRGLPITYFLHHLTRHTVETLLKLPSTVELGLHPDALDHPDDYDQLCTEQAMKIQRLADRPMRIVRNHGFQNRGYHGYVDIWQSLGLKLDVNYPGADGTALTGSFLPMRVRKIDKTWSEHYTLLTPFTDGMLYTLKLSEQEAVQRIHAVVRQIEASHPAALVFNLHPENVADARKIHAAVWALARRRGWIALGLESYLDWLETLESLEIEPIGHRFAISSPRQVTGLVIRYPTSKGWQRRRLPQWTGRIVVSSS